MHQDHAYPDPDLIVGYVARKGVKTFHTGAQTTNLEPDLTELGGGWFKLSDGTKVQGEAQAHNAELRAGLTPTESTFCGSHQLTDLKAGGWVRGLLRRGLTEHPECRKAREAFYTSLEEASYDLEGPAEASAAGEPE